MGKVKGQKVLRHAVTEVKKKIKKDKPKNIIKILKESETDEKPKYSLVQEQEKGIVYLGHIPHGFFEEQIKRYFRQFGTVLQVKVARSKRSGRSKGYAYILFKDVAVAKVAAETMNNYLMCGRLLKASFVPHEKQNEMYFHGPSYNKNNYPRLKNVKKIVAANHKQASQKDVIKKNNKVLKNLSALEEKLKSKGVNLSLTTV